MEVDASVGVPDAARDRAKSDNSTVSVASAESDGAGSVASGTSVAGEASVLATAVAVSPEDAARADALKDQGNKLFAAGKYAASATAYGQAIDLAPNAILYANRAFAELKRENYGSAIQDAEKSIQLDATYIKAYYRRASAYLALERYKLARADFKKVLKLKPGDKDTTAKLDVCEKAITRKAFEEAIAVEATKPLWERANPDLLVVDSAYSGLHLPAIPAPGTAASQLECAEDESRVNEHGMSLAFVKGLIETFRAQKSIHKKYAQQILQRLFNMARKLPSLVHATIPEDARKFNICGDTHGQYYDTLNIFEINGLPSPTNPYLFNGDFVDRGSFSVENVFTLFAFKLLYPDYFHLTRGNHETKNMNKMYGFEGEVKAKFDQMTMEMFSEVFCALPLSVVVNRKVIVIHGGLFQKEGVTLDDLAKIDRFREPPEQGLMSDVLWSDPQPFPGRGPSKRGVGQSFGPDVTERFLSNNGLQLVVRSHEVMDNGYQMFHAGKLITVFSAPNYCDQMGNKGAIVHLNQDCETTFTVFESVPHPPVKPMAYASGMSSMFGL